MSLVGSTRLSNHHSLPKVVLGSRVCSGVFRCVRVCSGVFFFLLKTSGERTVGAENEKDQQPGSQEQGALTAAASPLEEAVAYDIMHRRKFTTC